MPAITLGLAEVEDRLRVLRRRLNALTLMHALALGLSPMILFLAALILFGLRGSAGAFRVITWCGGALSIGALIAGLRQAHRRWLSLEKTARLVDQRGELTDRLTTIMDLRLRPRPARLAPVLVAQTLAMGTRWRADRIAPRRVPRSIYVLLAALLTFAGSPLIAPEPPAPTASASAAAAARIGSLASASPDTVRGSTAGIAGIETGSMAGQQPHAAPVPDGAMPASQSPPSALPEEKSKADSLFGLFPDRLRHAILSAFHAEQVDQSHQLTARADLSNRDPAGPGEHAKGDQDQDRQRASDAAQHGSKRQNSEEGPRAEKGKGQGKPKPGEQAAQHQDPNAANQNFDGNAPTAGDGTSPGGLMDAKGQNIVIDPNAPKTFKLTITSFLHAMEQKGDQPRQPGKKTSTTESASAGSATQVALSERQLNDDALRKAEIPPEYEDIVRRVYSLRGDQ